jgi:cbb3-type cytochrome oxidase maturation protein
MTGILYLIPIALAMGLAGLVAFLWALRSGQFDDLDGAAGRVLFDDPADTDRPASDRRLPP